MPRGVRAEVVRDERRRRRPETLDGMQRLKLALPSEFRDDPNFTYRWVNDDGSRIHDLTVEDDWDICTRAAHEGAEEDRVSRIVGKKENGQPLVAYLARKRLDWFEQDKQANSAQNNAREDAMLKRPEMDDPRAGQHVYVAAGSSIKRRGAYAP